MPSSLYDPALAHNDGKSGSELSSHASALYYTNEEIRVVHDIVTSAQERLYQLPEEDRLPTNELFQAYDAVLPAYGIDPENDQHLSRLVFRVGGERGGGTLLDKFRAVLSRMGIELEFDNTGSVPQGPASLSGEGTDYSVPLRNLEFRPRRRSDSDSNVVYQSRPPLHARPRRFSSSGEVTTGVVDAARLIHSQSPPRSTSQEYFSRQSPPPVPLAGGRDDAHADETSEFSSSAGGSRRRASTSAQGSDEGVAQGVHGFHDRHDILEERATQLEDIRLEYLVAGLFQTWSELAVDAEMREQGSASCVSPTHNAIESVFAQWKAFATWQTNVAEEVSRKQAYIRRCDRLAARARQIYVLTTALTLWHHFAGDRAERTAVARRHILRLRHFDSWKELALSEERTVRMFVQSLYFPRWVDRHLSLNRRESMAADIYRNTTLSKTFATWRLAAFEQSVQARRRRRVTKSTFGQWLQATCRVDEAANRGRSHHREAVGARTIQDWRAQASRLDSQEASSLCRLREITLSRTFHVWASPPSLEQVNRDLYTFGVTSRIFSTWCLDAKLETFQRQRNHQLLSDVFMTWVTSQRVTSFQLQRGRTLAEATFQLFLRRSEELEAQAGRDHVLQAARRVSSVPRAALFTTWCRAAASVTATENTAIDSTCEAARIYHLNIWHGAALRDVELDRWARRGYSYLAVHGNFDSWKDWARRERERKLRATYTTAKHGATLRLVLGCWRTWKADCALAPISRGVAEDRCQYHGRKLLHTAMDRWIWSVDQDAKSQRRCQILVLEGLFEQWGNAAAEHANEASDTSGLWLERLAGSCWNRWDLAYQWMEGQAYNAEKTAQRRHRETTTRLFLQWMHSAAPDRPEATDDVNRGVHNFGRSDIAWRGGASRYLYTPARVQRWSRSDRPGYNAQGRNEHSDNQDDELDSIIGSIDTPTRWTGLGRPIVGLPSTTPSAPLPTPYERELRIRYATDAGSGRRGGPDTHDSGVSSEHVSGG